MTTEEYVKSTLLGSLKNILAGKSIPDPSYCCHLFPLAQRVAFYYNLTDEGCSRMKNPFYLLTSWGQWSSAPDTTPAGPTPWKSEEAHGMKTLSSDVLVTCRHVGSWRGSLSLWWGEDLENLGARLVFASVCVWPLQAMSSAVQTLPACFSPYLGCVVMKLSWIWTTKLFSLLASPKLQRKEGKKFYFWEKAFIDCFWKVKAYLLKTTFRLCAVKMRHLFIHPS